VTADNWAYPRPMSWVTDRVEQERKASAMAAKQEPNYNPPPPAWLPVWDEIIAAMSRVVREFNHAQGAEQFSVRDQVHKFVEVVPVPGSHLRIATAVLQVADERGNCILSVRPRERA
jgi:hypothetical protein